jgi:hypothetical protein
MTSARLRSGFSSASLAAILLLAALPLHASRAEAQSQQARYVNPHLGVSFQPPQGWTADNVVNYLGPERQDGSRPVLTLIAHDSVLDLSDSGIESLAGDMIGTLENQGMQNIQVADRRKRNIAGLDSLQMDLTYQQAGVPLRYRQVYIPVKEHNRTYLFGLMDNARHFNESAPAAESAIASFVPNITRSGEAGAQPGPGGGGGAGAWTLLLVLLGVIALGIVVGALYLLLRRRAA